MRKIEDRIISVFVDEIKNFAYIFNALKKELRLYSRIFF